MALASSKRDGMGCSSPENRNYKGAIVADFPSGGKYDGKF
jgi:hypothetical protein